MKSITKRIAELQQMKARTSKIRSKAIQSLKSAKSSYRKSSSSIHSIRLRVSNIHSQLDEVSNTLQHSLAQNESIQRLKINAEERLNQEKVRKNQIEQIIQQSSDSAKEKLLENQRLKELMFEFNSISDHIDEIKSEIRQRNSIAKKVVKNIQECNTKKSKLSAQVKKTLESKSRLTKIMNESKKNMVKLEKRLPSLIKTGKNVQENLSKINLIVREEMKRKKSKAKRKAPRKSKAKRKAPRKRR